MAKHHRDAFDDLGKEMFPELGPFSVVKVNPVFFTLEFFKKL